MRLVLTTVLASIVACTATVGETLLRCDDCEEVRVSRVFDGDTFDTPSGRVRLFGVDTPELGDRCAAEAASRMNELAGNSVRLEDGPRLADQFGLIALISRGYGLTTWGFWILFLLPILVVGSKKILPTLIRRAE